MPSSDLVQSLSRGLSLLERIAGSDDGCGLNQLADDLGVKPPTAHNLLRTLIAHGYVEKSGRPVRYTLGPALSRLASSGSRRGWLMHAETVLTDLFHSLEDATVTVAEYIGGEVCITLRVSPEKPGAVEHPYGRQMHPYTSASSLVFQAFWGPDERADYQQRHPFWDYGAQVWQTPEAFEELLVQIRAQGYSSPPARGAATFLMSAPVFGPGGELVAGVGASIAGTVGKRRARGIVEAVVNAARELS